MENKDATQKTKPTFENRFCSFFRKLAVCLLICLPFVFVEFWLIVDVHDYHYPTVSLRSLLFLILTLLPTIAVLIVRKLKPRKAVKSVVGILCVLYLPVSFTFAAGILGYSETTDFRNYRELDADCLANRSSMFQELFPTWPHYFENVQQPDGHYEKIYLDAHYYYRYLPAFDYTYDIFAEWPLEQEEFDSEVARVTALFKTRASEKPYYQYTTMQKGPYTCLIYYDGSTPFEEVKDSYTYFIFAYNTENNKVRYIMCDSLENGADQPYYLQLNWQ